MELRPCELLLRLTAELTTTSMLLLVDWLTTLCAYIASTLFTVDLFVLLHKHPVSSHIFGKIFLALHLLTAIAKDNSGRNTLVPKRMAARDASQIGATSDTRTPDIVIVP